MQTNLQTDCSFNRHVKCSHCGSLKHNRPVHAYKFPPCTHCRQMGHYIARSSESHKIRHHQRGTPVDRFVRLQNLCKAQSTKHEHHRLALQCAYQVKYIRLWTAWLPYPPTCVAVQLKLNIKQQALSNTYFPTGNQSGQICQVLPPVPSTCWPSVSRFTARNCISTCRILLEWYHCAICMILYHYDSKHVTAVV